MLTREDLREWVWSRWGTHLQQATLLEIRESLPELQAQASPPPEDGVFVLDAAPTDYETAMREFFGQVLGGDCDEAAVVLWLAALELWLGILAADERGEDEA